MSGSRLMFCGIKRTVFARLRKKATQNGILIAHPAGEAVEGGVRIQWKYDPDAELLEVECVKTPFWIDAALRSYAMHQLDQRRHLSATCSGMAKMEFSSYSRSSEMAEHRA